MLKIDNPHAAVDGKANLNGISLRAGRRSKQCHRSLVALALAPALLAAGCKSRDAAAAHDPSAWRTDAVPEVQRDAPRGYAFPAQVFADLYEHFYPGQEGSPTLSIELSELGDDVVAISTVTGMLDDSVEGEQRRVVLERRGDGLWWIREEGRRFRCWRGARPRRWTTELCP